MTRVLQLINRTRTSIIIICVQLSCQFQTRICTKLIQSSNQSLILAWQDLKIARGWQSKALIKTRKCSRSLLRIGKKNFTGSLILVWQALAQKSKLRRILLTGMQRAESKLRKRELLTGEIQIILMRDILKIQITRNGIINLFFFTILIKFSILFVL